MRMMLLGLLTRLGGLRMKRIVRWLLQTCSLALGATTLFAAKPTDGVHPLVDAARSEFFGGTVDGVWKDGETMRPLVVGGETYRLYTPNAFVGTATGGKVYYSEDTAAEFGALSVDITLPNALQGATQLYAICGEWNALPRQAKPQSVTQQVYRDAVHTVLAAHGLPGAIVRITKLLRVDLEGDGIDEVIIAASTPRKDFPSPQARQNDYSLVLLRKVIDGTVVTIPLAEYYFTHDDKEIDPPIPYQYTLEAVLDVNGDGVMEVITGWNYYEGIGKTIHTVKGNRATAVLESGWGV